MTWLVTGGAGYIGSHVARALRGARPATSWCSTTCPAGTAASSGPGRAVRRGLGRWTRPPCARRWRDARRRPASSTWPASSTPGSRSSARCTPTRRTSPGRSVAARGDGATSASSSWCSPPVAAVFGTPDVDARHRATADRPESPYGESKLVGEWLIARRGAGSTGLRHTSLRYFNVVGSGSPDLYDTSPHNLFPLVLEALTEGRTPVVRGDDYPTPDGSCVRDYVHVADVATRTSRRREALEAGGRWSRSTTSAAATGGRVLADHGGDGPGHRASTSPPSSATAARATRPASSPPASSPRATWTGRPGARSTTASRRPGSPGARPSPPRLTGDPRASR